MNVPIIPAKLDTLTLKKAAKYKTADGMLVYMYIVSGQEAALMAYATHNPRVKRHVDTGQPLYFTSKRLGDTGILVPNVDGTQWDAIIMPTPMILIRA